MDLSSFSTVSTVNSRSASDSADLTITKAGKFRVGALFFITANMVNNGFTLKQNANGDFAFAVGAEDKSKLFRTRKGMKKGREFTDKTILDLLNTKYSGKTDFTLVNKGELDGFTYYIIVPVGQEVASDLADDQQDSVDASVETEIETEINL